MSRPEPCGARTDANLFGLLRDWTLGPDAFREVEHVGTWTMYRKVAVLCPTSACRSDQGDPATRASKSANSPVPAPAR